MAELKNTFSWSFSQAHDFAECKRRRYWNRYGMWGGWSAAAPVEARTAYRLKQMSNKWSLIGEAVESAILEVLERRRVNSPFSAESALEFAMTILRNAWSEHKSEHWRSKPKKYTCIKELYYEEISLDPGVERDEWAAQVRQRTEVCLQNFFSHVLPRLPNVPYDMMVPIARPGQGDPEHFHLGNVKVYAIPDWTYRHDGKLFIHDWKTGVRRERHQDQLRVYGLWAQKKHGAAPDELALYIEYLESGECMEVSYTAEIASALCDTITSSVRDMKQYLVDGDIERNEPLPKDSFPKTDDLSICRNCNFRELCNRKFAAYET